jgi:putative transposase
MPQYIRAFVPGGTFFFTVTLPERRRKLLTENIDHLREVFKAARRRRPFTIEAIVILEEGDYERQVDYIHYNPVKHGHVKRVADWPYSSFHRYVERGIYNLE